MCIQKRTPHIWAGKVLDLLKTINNYSARLWGLGGVRGRLQGIHRAKWMERHCPKFSNTAVVILSSSLFFYSHVLRFWARPYNMIWNEWFNTMLQGCWGHGIADVRRGTRPRGMWRQRLEWTHDISFLPRNVWSENDLCLSLGAEQGEVENNHNQH